MIDFSRFQSGERRESGNFEAISDVSNGAVGVCEDIEFSNAQVADDLCADSVVF